MLRIKKKVETENNQKEIETRRLLAPQIISQEDPAHYSVEELTYAISLPECKNIAITGVFGSGKSSIINTYLANEGVNKKVLKISLSNFDDKNEIAGDKAYENEIEFKLFQHIIYKADYEKTRGSRYKRLHVVQNADVKRAMRYIVAFIICFVIVFEPKVLQIEAFYRAYFYLFKNSADVVNIISDIIASCIMAYIVYKAFLSILCRCRYFSIKSFKAKDIEINFKKERSVFNKLLDEILYYFKTGEYELIVFEDLDRTKDPKKLFLKLREINVLLNESDYYKSKGQNIKFIYSIKDDIFQEEVRTKCFDYIIPVIPLVNSHNAGEFLLKYYKGVVRDINATDVKRLGAYITSMRELTNIMNEYMLYRKTLLKDGMSAKKLLALTIYKNLFPHDYSLVHSNDGCLFNAFNNKKLFIDPQIKDIEIEREKCIESIKKERDIITENRLKILDSLYQKSAITRLQINGILYPLNEIAKTDSLFNSFKNDKVEKWIIDSELSPEIGSYHYKFKDILVDVDPGNEFFETIGIHENEISKNSDKKRAIEKKIYNIERKTLYQLMRMNGDGKKSKELLTESVKEVVDKEEVKPYLIEVLNSMIYEGYISDDYTTYVSYTHQGSYDEQDFTFVQSVNQGVPLQYNYKLNHVDSIIDLIYSDSFENKSILNNDLLIYLLKGQRAASLDNFILTARANLDFVVQFERTEGNNDKFLKLLFSGWQGCVEIISGIQDNDIRTFMLRRLFRVAPTDFQLSTSEIDFISTQYKFITEDFENISINNLISFLRNNDIVFKELVEPNGGTKLLYDTILKQNRFEVNYANLKIVYGDDFDTRSYTAIQKGDATLNSYVMRDMNAVIGLFPETDTEETSESIVALARDRNVRDELFASFLERQNNTVPKLNNLPADRIPLFFKYDKVNATWDNVKSYFNADDDLSGIIPFIVKHVDDLAGTPINEDDDRPLQLLLMNDNITLPLEVYKKLLPSCGYLFGADEINQLNEERLLIILIDGFVKYDKDIKELYSSKSANLFGDFLIHFYDAFMADEGFSVQLPNATSIRVLNSSLTLEQKKRFMDKRVRLLNEVGREELSKLICLYYQQIPIDEDTNVSLLINALDISGEETSWKQKIDLVNRINDYYPYDETREKALLNSLGGGYLTLSKYRGISYFDGNQENRQLLLYLRDNGHYVNKVKDEGGRIKVTFKNPPADENDD